MRHGYLLLIVVGCGFESDRRAPDPIELVGGTWSFESAADFAAPGHVAVAMTIEKRGSLTPAAYTYGGLVARGTTATKLWTREDTTWAKLGGVTAMGAGLWRGEPITRDSVLEYIGIRGDKRTTTIWFEGEVWLDAGSGEQFDLDANDVAFVEIADPGTASYKHVTQNAGAVPVETRVTGWYPIRIGFADGNGDGSFNFLHSSGSAMVPWTRDRMRARASDLEGALRTVFGRQILGGGVAPSQLPVSHFEQRDLLMADAFETAPQGRGSDDDDWSARYVGEIYITQPGGYTLQIISDDGNRGGLGAEGEIVATRWGRGTGVGANPAVTMVSADLVAGWNQLLVDYNQFSGARSLRIEIQGPDFPSFVAVPRAQLRPVESADDRLAFGGDDEDREAANDRGPDVAATAIMKVAGFAGERVTEIDLTYEVDSDHWEQIGVDLETPTVGTMSGVRRTIRDHQAEDDDGNHVVQITIPAGTPGALAPLLGSSAHGDWKLHVYDDRSGGNRTTLKSAKITLHTTGGPEKIAKTASWTSPVQDATTDVFRIGNIAWKERLPEGSSIIVQVRACQQADCSDDPAWSALANGETLFDLPSPGRYLQVRVEMTSNGLKEPELGGLRIEYLRAPE